MLDYANAVGTRITPGGVFLGKQYPNDYEIGRAVAHRLCRESSWMRYISIDVVPKSKARPQFARGRAYDPSASAQKTLRSFLALKFREKIEGNITVACVFYRPNRQRIDADNLLKLVLDAATGVCWKDDSQVTGLAAFIEFDPKHPRTILVMGDSPSTMDRTLVGNYEYQCQICHKSFFAYGKNKKFCSRACMAVRNTRLAGEIACAWCTQTFRRRLTKQIFCSNDCRLASLTASKRAHQVPMPNCKLCGKKLSRHGYSLCRSCWRTAR